MLVKNIDIALKKRWIGFQGCTFLNRGSSRGTFDGKEI